jgi:uncharacterized phage infection (PIP) family protein YhgE
MDVQTIDNQYQQLQGQAQQTVQELKDLAGKLQASAQSGNQDAREWLLDLKSIALAIQAEQNQVANLLQALHGFVANQSQQQSSVPQTQQPWGQPQYPQQGYPQGYPQQGYPQQGYPQQQGGLLGGFMNSGFGRAIAMGAGFGIGDDIINSIF